ncbi:unnamed protein product [Brassica rapa]|uniref:Uncharacterized protein n=1 Tax=Brassica campestris TaxID=3711 RepID=A0A3P5Z111_BRACM|nr:unnamed protein product [Brassica rapa]VDC66900.1 unnamed protein product [Brassica rapa]
MATGVAYDDWSRCCVSSSPIHIYICEDESDTGDEQAREMRNKVMKLMVVNDKPENFFQVFTLTARFSEEFFLNSTNTEDFMAFIATDSEHEGESDSVDLDPTGHYNSSHYQSDDDIDIHHDKDS